MTVVGTHCQVTVVGTHCQVTVVGTHCQVTVVGTHCQVTVVGRKGPVVGKGGTVDNVQSVAQAVVVVVVVVFAATVKSGVVGPAVFLSLLSTHFCRPFYPPLLFRIL